LVLNKKLLRDGKIQPVEKSILPIAIFFTNSSESYTYLNIRPRQARPTVLLCFGGGELKSGITALQFSSYFSNKIPDPELAEGVLIQIIFHYE